MASGLAPDQSGEGLCLSLARSLTDILGCCYAFVAVPRPDDPEVMQTLALRGPEGELPALEYALKGTPCADVLDRGLCLHPQDVASLFPEDAMLREMGIQGYAGAPLVDSCGRVLGLAAALYRDPIPRLDLAKAVLQFVALRAATDLERREFQERLRAREENLRNLVASCPMGIHEHEVDAAGRLRFVGSNPAADRITGLDSAPLLGLETEEAFPGVRGTEVPERYREAALNGIPWEVRNLDYEADDLTGAFDVFAFQTAPGRMAAMFLEVSDRIRAEKALRQAQKMEAVGQLAGGVAHDFNNLLQAIHGYTELARQDLPEGHPAERSLAQVARASLRASSLTRRLLTFSRQEPPTPRPVALEPLLRDVVRLLRRILGSSVDVRLSVRPGLKCVLADPGQVEQILFNLCINARDAMPAGGTITVTAAPADPPPDLPGDREWMGITVADEGTGIPDELRDRIFEPFFTTKERGQGTGLGLTMVRSLAEGLGGRIVLAGAAEQGSEFRVLLPATILSPAEPAQDSEEAAHPFARGIIVVAEDDDLLRQFTSEVLRRAGGTVLACSNGVDALRLIREHRDEIAAAVLDMMMPRMGGREVYQKLLADGLAIPVLFISGYAYPMLEGPDLSNPQLDSLPKPYSPRVLLEKVRTLLAAAPSLEAPDQASF